MKWLLLALGLSLLAPGAAAQAVRLTFDAADAGCPTGRSMCYRISAGDLASLKPGVQVDVLVKNVGNVQHAWMATTMDKMDGKHMATPKSAALAKVEAVQANQQGSASFTVPAGAKGVYFWCAEPGHEQLGMWTLASFEAAKGKSPVPLAFVLVAIAGSLVVVGRRR